jgi:hypothetical protein
MRRWFVPFLASAGLVTVLAAVPVLAASYAQVGQVKDFPGTVKAFDISWFDRSSHSYLLADRTNRRIDVVDGTTGSYSRAIGSGEFVGVAVINGKVSNDHSGPDGVLVVHDQHQVWAGDGDSTVKVFDFRTGAAAGVISTGGTARADEMAHDQKDHMLIVANDADDPPFVTLIDTRDMKVVRKIDFPTATNGLEQPVWDPETHLFYLSVPELNGNPATGEIAVIDPIRMTIVNAFPVSECEPAGLTLGPHQHLLVGCSGDAIAAGFPAKSLVISTLDGSTVATITQVGGSDEVWFNPGDKHYYLAARSNPSAKGGPSLGIVDAESNTWIQNVRTVAGAHSVAADPNNNHIFVPLPAGAPGCSPSASGCIGIFALS